MFVEVVFDSVQREDFECATHCGDPTTSCLGPRSVVCLSFDARKKEPQSYSAVALDAGNTNRKLNSRESLLQGGKNCFNAAARVRGCCLKPIAFGGSNTLEIAIADGTHICKVSSPCVVISDQCRLFATKDRIVRSTSANTCH